MAVKKVWIEPGCIADGICNDLCPEVFGLDDNGEAFVEDGADLDANETGIEEAAENCPVEIIKYQKE